VLHRRLFSARSGLDEKQVGDIGACPEQYDAHGGKQKHEATPNVAHHLLPKWEDANSNIPVRLRMKRRKPTGNRRQFGLGSRYGCTSRETAHHAELS
jgi:hypothetical protein